MHPLAQILARAATGNFPPEDGRVTVLPSLDNGVNAVIAFSWRHVVAADVDPDWVAEHCPRFHLLAPISHGFISALAKETNTTPGILDLVLAAPGGTSAPVPRLTEIPPDNRNMRIARSLAIRSATRTFTTDDGAGLLILGRGVAGRRELAYEVRPDARNQGLARKLIASALAHTPADDFLWAQVAPGNTASLRALLACGFKPICAEILLAPNAT